MEYQVPQFIEVENKLIGPLTLKQFIYVAGTAGLCVVFILYLPTALGVILSIPVVVLGAALAFYKYNGKPFIEILEAGFNYYTGARFFLWRHDNEKEIEESAAVRAAAAAEAAAAPPRAQPKLTRGKLSELAWSLDIKRPGGGEEPE